MGMTLNIRTLRHQVQIRTSRHAEWEIRQIFSQVYTLLNERFPLLFYGAKTEEVEGALEITGMRMQPYDDTDTDVLTRTSTAMLQAELAKREAGTADHVV